MRWCVQEALLEAGQGVEGVIITQEDDLKIRRALSIARNIRFMMYGLNSIWCPDRVLLRTTSVAACSYGSQAGYATWSEMRNSVIIS